jgi:hypothetical protein
MSVPDVKATQVIREHMKVVVQQVSKSKNSNMGLVLKVKKHEKN